jgi:hypothetical protein
MIGVAKTFLESTMALRPSDSFRIRNDRSMTLHAIVNEQRLIQKPEESYAVNKEYSQAMHCDGFSEQRSNNRCSACDKE